MTEEVKTETTVDEPSPVEIKAREMGWKGKEEWQGSEEDFIDAKEFVRRKPLFDKIDELSRSFKSLKQAQDALVDHNSKLKEAEFKRAVDYLKAHRKQALLDNEPEKVLEAEERIEALETEQEEFQQNQQQLKQMQTSAQPHPALVSWRANNTWYQSDQAMTLFADALGKSLHSQGHPPEEILDRISKSVRTEFPHKFKNPNREKPGTVEGNNKVTTSNSIESSMTEDEKRIMNTILRSTKSLTKEKYLEQFKAIKGVK